MKKAMLLGLAACLMLSISGFASDAKEVKAQGYITDPMCAKSGDPVKMGDADCAKKCSKDGKLAFVDMSDKKVWAIENPDVVKGHEGHLVNLTGHPDADKGTIHVMTVAMADTKAGSHSKKDQKK